MWSNKNVIFYSYTMIYRNKVLYFHIVSDRNIKIYERYGLHIIEQGKGVGIARNISIVPYYVFDNVNTVDLTPPPSGPVLGES